MIGKSSEKFSSTYTDDLRLLVEEIIKEIFVHDSSVIFLIFLWVYSASTFKYYFQIDVRKLNVSLAYFIRDLFSLMNKFFVMKLIKNYFSRVSFSYENVLHMC